MIIEESLVAKLLATAAVTALVGARIEPLVLSQGATLPAIVYQRISGPRVRSHSGPSGLAHPRIQFTCWGSTYLQAKSVAKALRQTFDGFKDLAASPAIGGLFVENDLDDYEEETQTYQVIVDVIAWHSED